MGIGSESGKAGNQLLHGRTTSARNAAARVSVSPAVTTIRALSGRHGSNGSCRYDLQRTRHPWLFTGTDCAPSRPKARDYQPDFLQAEGRQVGDWCKAPTMRACTVGAKHRPLLAGG